MKYVITGGPGSGKTTLINELAKIGYETVPEAARIVIEREQERFANDKNYRPKLPWTDMRAFQDEVVSEHIANERKLEHDDKKVFLDRCAIDCIAYERFHFGTSRLQIPNTYYEKVFFLSPLEDYKQDEVRLESEEEAKKIKKELYKAYREKKQRIVTIPAVSLDERVARIIKGVQPQNDMDVMVHFIRGMYGM